jgi:hypothetical protein
VADRPRDQVSLPRGVLRMASRVPSPIPIGNGFPGALGIAPPIRYPIPIGNGFPGPLGMASPDPIPNTHWEWLPGCIGNSTRGSHKIEGGAIPNTHWEWVPRSDTQCPFGNGSPGPIPNTHWEWLSGGALGMTSLGPISRSVLGICANSMHLSPAPNVHSCCLHLV